MIDDDPEWIETSSILLLRKLLLQGEKIYLNIYFTNLSTSYLSTFMDPSDLNFGGLLFLLNNEDLRNKFRCVANKKVLLI